MTADTKVTRAIEFLRKLDEGATKGQWLGYWSQGGPQVTLEPTRKGTTFIAPYVSGIENAALIAHVRNVLPQLVAVVEAAYSEYGCEPGCTCRMGHVFRALADACAKEAVPPIIDP